MGGSELMLQEKEKRIFSRYKEKKSRILIAYFFSELF